MLYYYLYNNILIYQLRSQNKLICCRLAEPLRLRLELLWGAEPALTLFVKRCDIFNPVKMGSLAPAAGLRQPPSEGGGSGSAGSALSAARQTDTKYLGIK